MSGADGDARLDTCRDGLPRRSVLLGAAVAPLAACAAPDKTPPPTPAAGAPLVAVADVPVGSGTIVDGTMVTQPSAGVFKAFKARCTHAGCALTTIVDGAAECRCHGSKFNLDGSVARGPATEPLAARAVVVRGNEIVAG
ncbi:MAG: Rieske (2Fe-2S) protein [Mycobacterium sp.]|nr:Rieske (2Fe-2S) protein [Mycobacterium sp.]